MKRGGLVTFLLISGCSGLTRPPDPTDAGTEVFRFPTRTCSAWNRSDAGFTLGTEVTEFIAAGDLVVFTKGVLEPLMARRLSTGMERQLGNRTPLWTSLPSEDQIFELANAREVMSLITWDLVALDVDTCTRSRPIAQSVRGVPASTAAITNAAFCDPGHAWVTQTQVSNQLSVAGISAVSAPLRGNLNPACADQMLTWWSTDSATGEPAFINWARTDVDASVQLPAEGRLWPSKGLAISAGWTVWTESRTDGGSAVRAIETEAVWDGGVPRIAAEVPFTTYDLVGLRGDLATWRERSGDTTRLVVMNLRDGGLASREVPTNTQHAIVENGVVTLTAGTLEWDPSFHP